jgi:superfamily I DNA and/or RNA helicase
VFCTLSKAAKLDDYLNKDTDNFIYSLIDEASQTLETTSLGAVRQSTEKLILIGDQK